MKKVTPIPLETVQEGDTITVTKDHKDTRMILTGTVENIIIEGNTRIIDTAEGVELARYTIGKCHGMFVQLVNTKRTENEPLELFAS